MRITFFVSVLLVTLLMAAYVTLRGWQSLQGYTVARNAFLIVNIILFVTMLGGIMLQGSMSQTMAKTISFIGFSYMIAFIYMLLSFLLLDVVRLSNLAFHFFPNGMAGFRFWWTIVSLVVVAITMVYGNYKFNHPAVVKYDLQADEVVQHKTIKIVAASDIHLGYSIDKKMLQKYVDMINAQHPDIVLLAGDVSDRSMVPVIEQKMNEELSQIKAPLGVYAISGNHEYYSENPSETENYLKTAGITFLRDSVALVDSSFYVIGRDDRTNTRRKNLDALVSGLDTKLPKILLDHQPYHLQDAEKNGIDLQISGHTHKGQFFPGNLFVNRMYELGYGYLKKGKTHYYVSSGLGIWGPQYRIGTRSELVVINFTY